jgi:sterol desaturase/sphingolipid hydroxylase (fatty acid hydroxylase superfamily)
MNSLQNSREIFVLRSVTIIAMFSPGFQPAATKAYLLIFYAYSAFIHTNVAWNLECIGRVFVTTKFLYWHHDEERETGQSGEGNFASLLTTTLKALKQSYPNHTIHWLHGRLWLRPMRVQAGPIPELDSVFVPSPDSPGARGR